MKLTKKQQQELTIIEWFAGRSFPEETIKKFFEISDKGMHKQEAAEAMLGKGDKHLSAMLIAKSHRDLQITEWKRDWGSYCTAWDFVDEPEAVAKWIAFILDRPAIMQVWHEKRAEEWYEKAMTNKNKPMTLTRS